MQVMPYAQVERLALVVRRAEVRQETVARL